MARHIVVFADTSVILNFICSNNQRLLTAMGKGDPLCVPQAVANEVERKLQLTKFTLGQRVWRDLTTHGHVRILEDDFSKLMPHIRSFAGIGYRPQGGIAKNLGEFAAIAHCLVLQEENPGVKTAIIMDDGEGREIARKRQAALVFTTEHVLINAVRTGELTGKEQVRKVWIELSKFDVFEPFESTVLNDPRIYKR